MFCDFKICETIIQVTVLSTLNGFKVSSSCIFEKIASIIAFQIELNFIRYY